MKYEVFYTLYLLQYLPVPGVKGSAGVEMAPVSNAN